MTLVFKNLIREMRKSRNHKCHWTAHIVALKNSYLSVSDAILILCKVIWKKPSKGSKSCRRKDEVHFLWCTGTQKLEKGIDGKIDSDLVGKIIS